MKRIFPKERMILGFMGISFLIYLLSSGFRPELSFDVVSIMFYLPFGIGFGVCTNLITAHTAYTSDSLLIWSFFYRKKISFDKIAQIYRTWQGSGKSLRLRWYVIYKDKNKEVKTKLILPEDYDSENIARLIKAIKTVNGKFSFILGTGRAN